MLGNPMKPSSISISCKGSSTHLILLVLMLSGDIEANPGSGNASILPCGFCDKMSWADKGVACDACDVWFHCSCISISSTEYSALNCSSAEWKCYRCQSANAGSLFHSYNLEADHPENSVFTVHSLSPVFTSIVQSSPKHMVPSPLAHHSTAQLTSQSTSRITPTHSKSTRSSNSTKIKPKQHNFRSLVINANSIASKKAELESVLTYTDPDILIVTETKIDETVHTSEFLPANFKAFRKDRNRDGGVMIAVKENVTASEISIREVDGELIWVRVEPKNNSPLFICAFYRTPSESTEVTNCSSSKNHWNNCIAT